MQPSGRLHINKANTRKADTKVNAMKARNSKTRYRVVPMSQLLTTR
jgi:hypothetical protein